MANFLYIIYIGKRVIEVIEIEADSYTEAKQIAQKIKLKIIPLVRGEIQPVYTTEVIDAIQLPATVEEEWLKINRCIIKCKFYKLTVTETNIILELRLLKSRKEIAIVLIMSDTTLRTHFTHIFDKVLFYTDRKVERLLCEQ